MKNKKDIGIKNSKPKFRKSKKSPVTLAIANIADAEEAEEPGETGETEDGGFGTLLNVVRTRMAKRERTQRVQTRKRFALLVVGLETEVERHFKMQWKELNYIGNTNLQDSGDSVERKSKNLKSEEEMINVDSVKLILDIEGKIKALKENCLLINSNLNSNINLLLDVSKTVCSQAIVRSNSTIQQLKLTIDLLN